MLCIICSKPVNGQSPYCPAPDKPCGAIWRQRQPHLFTFPSATPATADKLGTARLILAMQTTAADKLGTARLILAMQTTAMVSETDIAKLAVLSKTVRTAAIVHPVQNAHRQVTHYDKSTPDGLNVQADQMLDIAILAYHGALEMKSQGKPVILYRIAAKGDLSDDEKQQTLSGRIRVKITNGGLNKEVWPLEKTAAWIQGAMRARVNFLLLSDPRRNLVGGKDGQSDAIFVRELHQIVCSHYMIAEAGDDDLTATMRKKEDARAFLLKPKTGTISTPIPLIPRMAQHLAQTPTTWDGTVSSLTISDAPYLIRLSLRQRFAEAGRKLGNMPEY